VRLRSLRDHPELASAVGAVEADGPPFLVALTARHRTHLDTVAPESTWLVEVDGAVVGAVRAVRLCWDGTPGDAPAGGAGEAVGRAGEPGADTLVVLDVRVATAHRGRGYGRRLLDRSDDLTTAVGCRRTLVLLRPHAKVAHPLTPFVRYLAALDPDGDPFDPWLRTAWRAGLVPVRGVDRSLVASAPLAAWEDWCGRRFPTSGPELVPGAIKPAIVEFERGEGRYREPHLWAAPRSSLVAAVPSTWTDALAAVGLVPGDRSHREPARRRVDPASS
jgi:GNAT superfamily N-acetyltransferase